MYRYITYENVSQYVRRFQTGYVYVDAMSDAIVFSAKTCPSSSFSAETSALRTPQPGGGAQKGGPVNSQYAVLFTQLFMIKVP